MTENPEVINDNYVFKDFETFTDEQKRVLMLLIQGERFSSVAKLTGIEKIKIFAWINEDGQFKDVLNKYQNMIFKSAMCRMMALVDTAINNIEELMKSDDERIQLYAADKIISYSSKFYESKEIESRIKNLEKNVEVSFKDKPMKELPPLIEKRFL